MVGEGNGCVAYIFFPAARMDVIYAIQRDQHTNGYTIFISQYTSVADKTFRKIFTF